MFLKELVKNRLITIIYSQNGLLKVCKGRVSKINCHNQTINITNEKQNTLSIDLRSIKEIQ